MSTVYQRGSSVRAAGEINKCLENGVWVKKDSLDRIPKPQTQLLFNLALPTNVLNRATRVGPPGPIVIEKLVAHQDRQDAGESCSSSLRFSVLSEDRLQAAVRLAKKDLRRKRQESINSLSHKTRARSPSPDKNKPDSQQNAISSKTRQKAGSPKSQAKSCRQVLVYTPQKIFQSSKAEQGQSPPTRDPELKAVSSEPQLSREIQKLQKVMETCIQRIEQLVNKGQVVESVEPEEKRRIEIRQQEQAARSARIIYVLQQQVKEIQEDLDRLHSQSIRPTNKCRVVNRLAAVHRGAVRAMQAFIQQLSDPIERRVPVQYKQLAQLIRQLSLCSAKVEVGQGSTIPETALDILQKLETLDMVLSKQDSQPEPCVQSLSPVRERTSRVSGRGTSLSWFSQAKSAKATRRPKKSSASKKNRRAAGRPLKAGQFLDQDRKDILKAGIQNLMRMRELRERKSWSRPDMDIPKSPSGSTHPDKSKLSVHVCDAGFQQPTVSSKLRENNLQQKEASVPWIPTSPHSPVKQRAVSSRPEPKCLFSPVKNNSSSQPTSVQAKSQNQGKTSTENVRDAQNEALRAEVGAEQVTREKLQPLLDCVQQIGEDWGKNSSPTQQMLEQAANKTAVSTDVEAPVGAVQRVDGEHDALLQDPMLDNMLLRMEEIEKDEEEVRRRFAMISYSDPLLWDIDTGTRRKPNSSRPASPQPIILTKPVQRLATTGDIVLQRPVETGVGSESSMLDEEPPDAVPGCPSTDQAQKKGAIQLKVPCSIQKNVQRYREEYDSYLRLVSHAAVGSFNPLAIAESLAEELMMEALGDVAAEFQDVCEECADAIFTSEFLQPIQSPSQSVS
ncbi:protein moonraker isoform X2 [Neoarius graeffei]|uniref:protein moonraker isoform X2 n=1 Tax=Neoarius graeffei TaxID=443677 RepID=UPI00298C7A83|nr:protein moonraker isoform X2 [Neoarius graeffei]